jgi:NADPH:quinone reductase-like Zn-dependent oxidoreductase
VRYYHLPAFAGVEALTLGQRPVPRPGPREVLVRMRAWSLNHRDLLIASGQYGREVRPDVVPVSDGAGEIVETGSDVTRWRKGDRVVSVFLPRWHSGAPTQAKLHDALGSTVDGVFAEYVTFDSDAVVRAPAHLDDAEAATLPCAAVTAWQCLVVQGGLTAGETILALGSGGVSVFCVQLAGLCGARAIVTSSSDDKLDRLRQLGAADGINYMQYPQWGRLVQQRTGGVDHVMELVGAVTLPQSIRAARIGGRLSIVGVLSSGVAIDHVQLLRKALTVQGVQVGSRESFESMNRAIELSGIHPVIDRTFPFTDAAAAYHYLGAGRHFGKVVITAS